MAKRSRRAAAPGSAADAQSEVRPDEVRPDEGRQDAEGSQGAVPLESSLEALESIVDRLESGELPLEAALAAFEAGVALTRRCAERLEAAERRIELLVREGERWVSRPFEESEEAD